MNALDSLAARVGIEPEYEDAFHRVIETKLETKRALLEAMGFDAEDEENVRAALTDLDIAEMERPLFPVQVVRDDEHPWRIPLTLPAETGEVRWEIREEEGRVHRGAARFSNLRLKARGRIGETRYERRWLAVEANLPLGYHRLRLDWSGGRRRADMPLIVVPRRCWLPPEVEGGARLWGIATQLYLLRSRRDWGIGDFTDLREFVAVAARLGASMVGLNPLHALFPTWPENASPYSPSSRLFLNVLNIDPTTIPEFAGSEEAQAHVASEEFRANLEAARASRLVDYTRVARLKLPVLEMIHRTFRDRAPPERKKEFDDFRRERGRPLERFSRFHALLDHMLARDPNLGFWRHWPEDYRDPDSPGVETFARESAERVDFHAWMQWVADDQLTEACLEAERAGMPVGLYRDLAVGADAGGAETWSGQDAIVTEARVGAPPDVFNPAGQDWGLPPFSPIALREEGYRRFINLVRANMRHAGGLRIDHFMGILRLFWIPEGHPSSEGTYVGYPMDDLIGILALESHRNRCLVVGEDLGTVPKGLRERMANSAILSYRVLFFEQDEETGEFIPPQDYPHLALATVSSHDLPTLHGWWTGHDIDLKERHGLYPSPDETAAQRHRRDRDRARLIQALSHEDLHPDAAPERMSLGLSKAVHAFLARTPACLAAVQLDDLLDEAEQVNLPATHGEHPNWRRKFSVPIENLEANNAVRELTGIMRATRPRHLGIASETGEVGRDG